MDELIQQLRESRKLSQRGLSSLVSINRKIIGIQAELQLINELVQRILANLDERSHDDENLLICKLTNFADQIYSVMEYVSQVLKDFYSGEHNLPDGFSDLQKWVKKNDACNEGLKEFVSKCHNWYYLSHAIRSEEEHFQMGRLGYEYSAAGGVRIKYENAKRSPRSSALIRSPQFMFDLEECNNIFLHFERMLEDFVNLLGTKG